MKLTKFSSIISLSPFIYEINLNNLNSGSCIISHKINVHAKLRAASNKINRDDFSILLSVEILIQRYSVPFSSKIKHPYTLI